MRTALIGHRGVGKTTLLARVEKYFADAGKTVQIFDLDKRIEVRTGQAIATIFSEQGEEAFRKLEREEMRLLDQETSGEKSEIFVALGAGFDPQLIPASWRVLWVRRPTDEKGRIFLDRPRLNASVPSLDEFNERYHRRQAAYKARADETLFLDEGIEDADAAERSFFLGTFENLGGALTLLPENFRDASKLEAWLGKRVRWGIRWFELRDDLLSEEQMDQAIRILPDDRVLVSFRKSGVNTAALVEKNGLAFDWPLELGECTVGEPRVLSLHERREGQSISDALARFETPLAEGAILKAALPVRSFAELAEGHSWQQQAPESRSFLPLSDDGRWAWYRLLTSPQAPLSFLREGDGSGADQPRLLQWARVRGLGVKRFAALLGDPAAHSRTPLEQWEFFAKAQAPVFAIRMTEEEWSQGALEVLRSLGLRWAAVTAPLKAHAFWTCVWRDDEAKALESVNTIQWQEDGWHGWNTDREGLQVVIDRLRKEKALGRIAVWGGGGTLQVVKTVAREAELFSLRTRENRDDKGPRASAFDPECVIWAVGRSRSDKNDPPPEWRPKLVVDLNYAEDSPGRAFALATGARYVSGLEMFKAQAAAQRRHWRI